ncbi:MAG: hypothetical protein LBP67_07500 [Bacteroidales bacterium]|jgi:hypothetical protein|nr:hypothetical protein [Bacteroidales bacterium]
MNDVFSFKRFALLIKAFWKENKKKEMWFFITLTSVLVLIFINLLLFAIKNNNPEGNVSFYFDYIFILLAGAVFLIMLSAGNILGKLSKKENAMFMLSTPASALEHTSVAFLFNMIIYPAIFIILVYILNFLFIGIYCNSIGVNWNMFKLSEISFNDYFGFFTIISGMIFGTVYFKKLGLPKSFFIFGAYIVLQLVIINQFMPEGASFMGEFTNMDIIEKGTGRRITIDGFMYYFKYLLFPLFWVLTFLRLKEREV